VENGFSYFTIRVQQPAASSDVHLTGVIECLRTVSAGTLPRGEELVRFVADWRGRCGEDGAWAGGEQWVAVAYLRGKHNPDPTLHFPPPS
jgi:hypothetical protein